MSLTFEWNQQKAEDNLKKHFVDFQDAQEVFFDVYRTGVYDDLEYGEDRYVTVGLVGPVVLPVVYSTPHDATIRLISARKAKADEQKSYWKCRPPYH